MLCKGTVIENNSRRSCWLPADRGSTFQLCRRCHFHKVTNLLDTFTCNYSEGIRNPQNEAILNDHTFLEELLHPAREQALLNLLNALFQNNKEQCFLILKKLKHKSIFTVLLSKRIVMHQTGSKCGFYRCCMGKKDIFKTDNLPWNCWPCIAWCLKQRDDHLLENYTKKFGIYFSQLTFERYSSAGSRVFIDILTSLYLLDKKHHIRVLLDHMIRYFPLEDVKSLIVGFLQMPCMLSVLYENKQEEYLPAPLCDAVVVQEFKRLNKQFIKNKTDIFKEELMIKTWHPKRLFPWCMDIEDWKDFNYSGTEDLGFEGYD